MNQKSNQQEAGVREPPAQEDKKFKYNPVFWISAVLAVVIALWGILFPKAFESAAAVLMRGLKDDFSWLYLWGGLFFVLFCIGLACTKFGKVRLGADDEKPVYSTGSWIAMLFAAGMGIGLVFWGVAEPLSHYIAPMAGIKPLSAESEAFSIRSCIMHWGLHPWAIYAVVGLAMAYFGYRWKRRLLISRTVKPILGRLWSGPLGMVIDIYAVLLTTIGVATSFGMGCLQINSGLTYLFGIPSEPLVWIILITVICVIYLLGSVTGISKGMKYLSNTNMVLCAILMILAFIVGSQVDILQAWLIGLKDYVVNFFPDSVRMESNGDPTWIQNWRVFYWAWWLSWAPFVGVFIARISQGRTIREFVFGAMIVPTLVSSLWFAIFGEAGINVASAFSTEELSAMVASPETALFLVFDKYPLGLVLSIIAMLLLFFFFVTSATSATYVVSMFTHSGDKNPPAKKQVFWGVLMAAIAFALILSGGVAGIQTIAIVIAFPFFFVMIIMCISIVKALIEEQKGCVPLPDEKLSPANNDE